MGVYKILPHATLHPRRTITYMDAKGPVLSLEADLNGVPMLGGRELGEVLVAILPHIDEPWLEKAKAVLEAAGWVHPDKHAGEVAKYQQIADESTIALGKALTDRDALAQVIDILKPAAEQNTEPDPEPPAAAAARKPRQTREKAA